MKLSDQKKSTSSSASSSGNSQLPQIHDLKELKKLLKSKNNILIYYESKSQNNQKTEPNIPKLLEESNYEIRGIGTIAIVKCFSSTETEKLCKKLKIFSPGSGESNTGSFVLKHYKDGEYHKDYDRALKTESLVRFMKDPTGDLPWDEDQTGKHIVHFKNPQALQKLISKTSKSSPALIMFYAPWCGYCKKMKPDYGAAAEALTSREMSKLGIIGAVDASASENSMLRQKYNISGFPTILYFTGPNNYRVYEGENTKDGILDFMKNPNEKRAGKAAEKVKEISWAEEDADGAVVHLTAGNFDEFIQSSTSVLVMFYAPWCGHCKKLKPAYSAAARKLQSLQIDGNLAAVDATTEPELAKRFSVSGYPTIKYFKDGNSKEPEFELSSNTRDEESLIEFMRNPTPPPPPPPPEIPWSEEDEDGPVVHLTNKNFKASLSQKSVALVMFYAPWCGYCKQTKPEFIGAAEGIANGENQKDILFGAVDCTQESELCGKYEVKGYPTFKMFKNFGSKETAEVVAYDGGRTVSMHCACCHADELFV